MSGMNFEMHLYVCEKAEFSLHNATLLNAPEIQLFILIQKELGFGDFLCDRAVSFALEDKNFDPSPMLLVVAFFLCSSATG